MGLTWEECGGYVPAMQRGPQDTAQTEMQRQADAAERETNERLTNEVERLTDCLKQANLSTQHFEREWYLACDEIERLTEALQVARDAVYYDAFQLGWDIDRLDEVLAHNATLSGVSAAGEHHDE